MAIYGIGAYYDSDMSQDFIASNLVGIGWSESEAPELHHFIRSLKPGDLVYIKSYSPTSDFIFVKAIGLISDEQVLGNEESGGLVESGRRVTWLDTEEFRFAKPRERNNVRRNTLYEEHHPLVRREILGRFISRLRPANA